VLIVPISIARFASYAGARVPDGFTFLADLIYALGGLFILLIPPPTTNYPILLAPHLTRPPVRIGFTNLMLFLGTRRYIPDPSTIPDPSMPRMRLDKASRTGGITPFTLTSVDDGADAEEQRRVMVAAPSDGEASVSYPEKSTESETDRETLDHRVSVGSHESIASRESTLPLNPRSRS